MPSPAKKPINWKRDIPVVLIFLLFMAAVNWILFGAHVRIVNSTDGFIRVSYLVSSKYPGGKRTHSTYSTTYLSGEVWNARPSAYDELAITIGNRKHYYSDEVIENVYDNRAHLFDRRLRRLAYATLEENGCFYRAAGLGENGTAEIPQPAGWPMCPINTVDLPLGDPQWQATSREARTLAVQVSTWSCPAAPGTEHIRPLYGIDASDAPRIREARERITLRSNKEHDSWDAATLKFAQDQHKLHNAYYATSFHRDNTLYELRRKASGAQPDAPDELERYVNEHKRYYDSYCDERKLRLQEVLAEEPGLVALRRQPDRPWLREENRLTCDIAEVSGCIPRDATRDAW